MTDDVAGKKMVAGFLFSGPRVLLVEKIKPTWQAGLLNGVGGVIDPDETPSAAIEREFCEETGLPPGTLEWRHFCTEKEPFGAYVYFYTAHLMDRRRHPWPVHNDVGEHLRWLHHHEILTGKWRTLGNLSWLLPLALDWREFNSPVLVEAKRDIREAATW